jgi:general secretion pathway protein D
VPLRAAQQPPVAAKPAEPSAAPAAQAPALKPGEVLLNFQAADIQGVVKAVSQMTGRNFLLDPRVKGQITIITAKPVSSASAYQIFLSALKAQGFTAVEGIGVVRIVPTSEAKTSAEVSQAPVPRGGEQIVTHVLIVQHTSATQMVPLLRPLMAPTSQLSAYDPANALIITDYADNIRRLLRIVEKIDQPVSSEVTIVPLKHASALDLTELVMRLSLPGAAHAVQPGAPPGAAAGGDRFTIVPDLRTNSLLIRADNPGRVNQLRSLIEKLDVPAVTGGQTRVLYLRNADAVKLAELLRGLLAGEARAQAAVAAATGAPAPAMTAKSAMARAAETSLIQADEATNALVINTSDTVYNNLRGVIEKLDVRRAQVFVEALIVEMTTDVADQLGFQWFGGKERGVGAVGALQNFPNAGPGLVAAGVDPAGALATSGGLTLAYLGEKIVLPDGSTIRSLGALARALEQQNLANILSTPNLMTLDNAEAKIMVGQNVPFVTGSFAQATGTTGMTVNPFQTIERKDVGLTLKIKPQVSEGGTIKLDIFQEVSSLSRAAITGASDLVTNKRSLETKVIVDDAHTIVLGGLIEDTSQESEQAVPLLGRIPLLGALFRYRENSTRKTNLMVFLRPVIVRNPQDSYSVTADRYQYLRVQTKGLEQAPAFERFKPTPPLPPQEKEKKKAPDKPNEPDEAAKSESPPETPAP